MSKSSKKRKIPKISKLGKYFKFKRRSKKKNIEVVDNDDHDGRSLTPTCLPEYTKITDDLNENEEHKDKATAKKELEIILENGKNTVLGPKEENGFTNDKGEASNIKDFSHVEVNDTRSGFEENSNTISAADIVIHGSVPEVLIKKEDTDAENKCTLAKEENTSNTHCTDATEPTGLLPSATSPSVATPTDYSLTEGDELIYPVLVQTPFQTQKQHEEESMKDEKASNDCTIVQRCQPIPCKVVVHTPQQKKTDENSEIKCEAKTTIDVDEEFELTELPDTPSPKKPEKKGSQRMFTVKKIRSIIATPYKRLKRDSSSLMDGQTYRYIEIQSLVKAFETLHSCKGGIIALNEKGIQYGKSSVLRIECKDCNTKVFLQATQT